MERLPRMPEPSYRDTVFTVSSAANSRLHLFCAIVALPQPLSLGSSQAHHPLDYLLGDKAKHTESQHEEENKGA